MASALPPTLVRLWATTRRGFLLLNEGERARYEAGPFLWRHVQGEGAIYLPPACKPAQLWRNVGAWLDDFMGSFGAGLRLSEGNGATSSLEASAARWQELHALGYSSDYFSCAPPAARFPLAVSAFLHDRQTLSTADPLLVRWLRGTLFDEGFWRQVAAEHRSGRA